MRSYFPPHFFPVAMQHGSETDASGVEHTGGENRHQHTERDRVQSTMEAIHGLWRDLPFEMLEHVLPFLTVPDLCRFRTVCRRWNSLICTPEFTSLCVHNVSTGVSRGACFVVKVRRLEESCERGRRCELSMCIFDLNTKRWYIVKDELPKDYHHSVWDVDGGLVCTFGNAVTEEQRRASTIDNPETSEPQMLVLFNLIENRRRVLPNPPLLRIDLSDLDLKLVVDNVSHTCKLFLIFVGRIWNSGNPYMCVYESSTQKWRSSQIQPESWDKLGHHIRSVVFQGHLFGLFGTGFYKYNFEEDAWEGTGVRFWSESKYSADLGLCDLVVADNRLFLTTQRLIDRTKNEERRERERRRDFKYGRRRDTPASWPLDISEILLAEKVCKTVVQMREKELMESFDIEPNDHGRFKIRAHGFDKAILLMSEKVHGETGKYVLYSLVTGLWEVLPPNPVERLQVPSAHRGSMWRQGKQMSYLRLPNTPCS